MDEHYHLACYEPHERPQPAGTGLGEAAEALSRLLGRSRPNAPCCSRCGSSARMMRHGQVTRMLRDVPRDGRPTWLRLDLTRWRCGGCGGTCTPAVEGLATRRRLTPGLMDWLARQAGQRPVAQLAREAGVDEKTVRRLGRLS
ncbi:transposase family protein [Aquabacterium sp. A7-Y]|uniref:transposase family protein n=1 Tax=Aquabacterium sp. A7-Y TaxID=1349605 RepID=UPI00223D785C|nr:transposase family protein [Aquabacterium sp. A7-Y]MCW7539535.1 transposase family protein [Aquabacterium sp. A7-Y]